MTTYTEIHRVPVRGLEVNISYGCNLQCEYCTHLGRFMKGTVPLEDLLLWYRSWNTKVRPKRIRILGGEPLLHPDLENILYETRRYWQDAHITLITNGLLLPKMDGSIFYALKETETDVSVSKHFDDPYFNRLFTAGIDVLREHGIEPQVLRSNGWWMKCYRIDEHGDARPYQSNPEKAWHICGVKNICTTLLDNCLYRCPQLACYSYAVRKGFVPLEEWNAVLDYRPLTPDCTQEELEAFMKSGACEQCSICPEEFQYADMYEKINLFGHPLTKKLFCGDPNDDPT